MLYFCVKCKTKFNSREDLEYHLRIAHVRLLPYMCSECPHIRLPSESATKQHMTTMHPNMKEYTVLFEVKPVLEKQLHQLMEECLLMGKQCSDGDTEHHQREHDDSFSLNERIKITLEAQALAKTLPHTDRDKACCRQCGVVLPSAFRLNHMNTCPVASTHFLTTAAVQLDRCFGRDASVDVGERQTVAAFRSALVLDKNVTQRPANVKWLPPTASSTTSLHKRLRQQMKNAALKPIAPQRNKIQCQLCRSMVGTERLAKHVAETHLLAQRYKCTVCSMTAPQPRLLLEHMKTVHKGHVFGNRGQLLKLGVRDKTEYEQDVGRIYAKCFPALISMFPATDSKKASGLPLPPSKKETTANEKPNKHSMVLCRLCKSTMYLGSATHHVFKSHIKKPLYQCSLCPNISSVHDKEIRRHIHKSHSQKAATVLSLRSRYSDEAKVVYRECFGLEYKPNVVHA